jgi:hypothetical protein
VYSGVIKHEFLSNSNGLWRCILKVLVSSVHSVYKLVVILAKNRYGLDLVWEYISEHCTHTRSCVCMVDQGEFG